MKKRILSILLTLVMVIGMLPTVALAATGAGTESDPLYVTTFAELKTALQEEKDSYIVVNSFTNTTGLDHYNLNDDYTVAGASAISIPAGYTKTLVVNTTIDCRASHLERHLSCFISNAGNLTIMGNGTINCGFNVSRRGLEYLSKNSVIYNTGTLTVKENPTLTTLNSDVTCARHAIWNAGNATIEGGTFIGCCDIPNETQGTQVIDDCYAVLNDGTMTIKDGTFEAYTIRTGKTAYGLYSVNTNLSIFGGVFNGIESNTTMNREETDAPISSFLASGYEYRKDADNSFFNGSAVSETGETLYVAPTGSVKHSITVEKGTASLDKAFAGTKVTLTADPADPGYVFDKWEVVSGGAVLNGNEFEMPNDDVEVKAVYKAKTFTITVSAEPSEGGVVTVEGTYLEDTPASSGTYEMNTPVSITATANEGYEFVKWTENGIDIDAIQNFGFDVKRDRSLVAVFAPKTTAPKTLSSITVTTPPDDTDYIPGESFESIGMVVTATYSDDSTAPVTGYTVTNGTALTVGQTSVTISYTEGEVTKTTTQAITVEYDVLLFADNNDGIAEKTVQTEGGVFTFPAADTLTAPAGKKFSHWTVRDDVYNPGDTLTITENAIFVFANWKDICTVTIGDVTVEGTTGKEIDTVGVKLTFSVGSYIFANVQAGTDVSGWFTNLPAGLKAKVDYKNANYIVVTISGTPTAISSDTIAVTISGTPTAISSDTIAVTVPGSALVDSESITAETNTNAKYAITAGSVIPTPKTLTEISVTTAPSKTTYTAGEDFDKTGMVVTATYSDSSTASVTGYTVTDGVNLAEGKTYVTISYTEDGVTKTTTQAITVNAAPVVPDTYTVTVINGTSDKATAAAGDTVTITAAAAPDGKVFDKWVVTGVSVADATAATTTFTMPASNVTAEATYKNAPVTYTITFDANGGSVSPASKETGTDGKLDSLPTPTHSGSYSFDGWYSAKNGGTKITTSTVFTTDTTVYAHWTYTGGGGIVIPTVFPVNVKDSDNGEVKASAKYAAPGSTIKLTVTPDEGYELDTLTVKSGSKFIDVTEKNGKYQFVMPFGSVTVTATFKKIETPVVPDPVVPSFDDVAEDTYYFDAVEWAVENGITTGTSDTTFSPDLTCTRAQAVTFLWRAAGSPEPKSNVMPFEDVAAEAYYYKAVLWAVENGITKGTSATTFSPDADCTRAQIVTFLWRAQKSPAAIGVNPFTDVAADAYYVDAVLWAVEEKVTNGTSETTFSPDADCTRAQIVTFLYRALNEQ